MRPTHTLVRPRSTEGALRTNRRCRIGRLALGLVAAGLALLLTGACSREEGRRSTTDTCVPTADIQRLHDSLYLLERPRERASSAEHALPRPMNDEGPQFRVYNRLVFELEAAIRAPPGTRRVMLESLRADLTTWVCLTSELHDSFHERLESRPPGHI